MPSCDACDRHWTPSSMRPDGSCPTCGQVLPVVPSKTGPTAHEEPAAPWHFKLLLGTLAVYLAWRGVQGLEWLVRHV